MTSKPTSSNSETDAIMTALFAREDLPPLEPGTHVYSAELRDRIRGLQGREHKFVLAALHLLNDDIHHAHLIAQDNEGDSTADLLHATLHRREGDYWNSKYWLSHIRSHPTVSSIPDAKAFVDACEAVKAKSGTSRNRRQGGAAGTKVGGNQETKAGVGADGAGQDEETKLRVKQWEELKRLILWTRENCVL